MQRLHAAGGRRPRPLLGVKGGSIAYRMAEQNCTSRLMRECLLGALVL